MKIVVSCANGAGSSLMIKLKADKILKSMGVKADIVHCPLSEGTTVANNCDVVLTAKNFAPMFKNAEAKGTLIYGLKNVMSEAEIKAALEDAVAKLAR